MEVEEFLKSNSAGRRHRIFRYDAVVRQLRHRGASFQAIANYLSLEGVEITRWGVWQYLRRYPDPPAQASTIEVRTSPRLPPADDAMARRHEPHGARAAPPLPEAAGDKVPIEENQEAANAAPDDAASGQSPLGIEKPNESSKPEAFEGEQQAPRQYDSSNPPGEDAEQPHSGSLPKNRRIELAIVDLDSPEAKAAFQRHRRKTWGSSF